MRKRIWELDALRGLLILIMVGFHLMYDLVYLYGIVQFSSNAAYKVYVFFNNWAGVPFLVLSGLCASFGTRPVKRGLQVLCCGMVITAVTAGMYWLGLTDQGILIYFGVLQCLGICMLLWPLFRKLKNPLLLLLGLTMAAIGIYLRFYARVDFDWLMILGLRSENFASSDYFPLLPNLGYFLIGSVLGRWLYPTRETRFPNATVSENGLIRFLGFCGNHSLAIYMLHQPILAALIGGWVALFS